MRVARGCAGAVVDSDALDAACGVDEPSPVNSPVKAGTISVGAIVVVVVIVGMKLLGGPDLTGLLTGDGSSTPQAASNASEST
ncbi:MAG: hypothetical protein AAFY46_04125, partial [Planctomycetota bacterium]